MRAALVLAAALATAACGAPHQVVTGSGYDQYGCKISCDKCPPLTLCIGAPYVPACLVQCRLSTDCDAGVCVIIGSVDGPSVCFGTLMQCDPPTDCTLTAQCRDVNTALKPLAPALGVCGLEVIHCDSGCDSATGSCK